VTTSGGGHLESVVSEARYLSFHKKTVKKAACLRTGYFNQYLRKMVGTQRTVTRTCE